MKTFFEFLDVLAIATVGATLLVFLFFVTPSEHLASLLPIAAAYVGSLGGMPWRRNVIAIVIVSAVMIMALAWLLAETHGLAVLTIAGGLIGLLIGIARELSAPEPEPAVPASLVSEALTLASQRAPSPGA